MGNLGQVISTCLIPRFNARPTIQHLNSSLPLFFSLYSNCCEILPPPILEPLIRIAFGALCAPCFKPPILSTHVNPNLPSRSVSSVIPPQNLPALLALPSTAPPSLVVTGASDTRLLSRTGRLKKHMWNPIILV